MAAENGVEETYNQQLYVTASTSGFVGQLTGTANDENGIKKEVSHGEPPHSSVLDTAGSSKNNEKYISNTEHEKKAKRRTSETPGCKLHLNSPSERESRSHSRGQSRRKTRSPSGSSSSSSRSRSHTYNSRSKSSSRSASHSRRYRRYRRSSRSSSRSRSRSPGSRYRRHRSRSHGSPRRYNRSRSRSRSHVKVYCGRYRSRSRSRSCSRGRRHYGFVHRPRPATFRSWRSRSRSRSRLHLTEKDRCELLEIAKANAAKALGKSVDLPPSLKKDSWLSDTLHRSLEGDLTKLNKQSRNLNNTVIAEVSPQKAANVSSTNSTVVHPVLNKQVNSLGSSQKKEEPKKALGQWIPIQCQRSSNRP